MRISDRIRAIAILPFVLVAACASPTGARTDDDSKAPTPSTGPVVGLDRDSAEFQDRLATYVEMHGAPVDEISMVDGGALLFDKGIVLPWGAAAKHVYSQHSFPDWELSGPWGQFESWSTDQATANGEAPEVIEDVRSQLEPYPQFTWLAGTEFDTSTTESRVRTAAEDGAHPLLTIYNIPSRDCGGPSAGGASSPSEYVEWTNQIADKLVGGPSALIVLEPDALGHLVNSNCDPAIRTQTIDLLKQAIAIYKAVQPDSRIFVSVSNWAGTQMEIQAQADILNELGVGTIDGPTGFAVDVAGDRTDKDMTAYGEALAALTKGAAFITETSRNGVRPDADGRTEVYDDLDRAPGLPPSPMAQSPHHAGNFWIKPIVETDATSAIAACANSDGQVCFTAAHQMLANAPDTRVASGTFTLKGTDVAFRSQLPPLVLAPLQ